MTKQENAKKLTYEQLENVAKQLSEQLTSANKQIYQMGGTLTRLPFLFEVLKHSEFFNADFVKSCAADIEEAITIPEQTKDNEQAQ